MSRPLQKLLPLATDLDETRGDAPLRLQDCLAQADPARGGDREMALAAAREAVLLATRLERLDAAAQASGWLCGHLFQSGRHAEMLAEAEASLALLQQQGLDAEHRELLGLVALAGSETGAHDVALDAAQALVKLTADGGTAKERLSAAFGLAVCFERMGDSWQAARLLSQAIADHGDAAPQRERMVALNALCAISMGEMHSLNGAAPDDEVQQALARARTAAEAAAQLLQAVQDPIYEVVVRSNLGEVLTYQGELAAAHPLLQEGHRLAVQQGFRARAWRVRASLCIWQLTQGDAQRALADAQVLISEAGGEMPLETAIRAHHVAYRAARALHRHETALQHFEVVDRLQRRRTTTQLRAQSQLFVTRTETQQAQWRAEQSRLDAQRQRERAAEFAESAERDALTGLGNRRHFTRRSGELMAQVQRHGTPLVLALVDVDHFKAINDTHGHAVGDRVLTGLAHLLRDNARASDVLTRYGGEEFLILLPGVTLQQATEACERLRERVAQNCWEVGIDGPLTLTISLGLASTPPDEIETLLSRADAALYAAKRSGRNRLVTG